MIGTIVGGIVLVILYVSMIFGIYHISFKLFDKLFKLGRRKGLEEKIK